MIYLTADNRSALGETPYTYLLDNVSSGSRYLPVANVSGLSVDDLILVGKIGSENSAIFRISSIDSTNNHIYIALASGNSTETEYSYPESTIVAQVPYNQVRFYHTTTADVDANGDPVFNSSNPLTAWTDIQIDDWYTSYGDSSNSTGYGWFVFRNSVTSDSSQTSHPIPYAGFGYDTVQQLFNDFLSLLNNRELKLVNTEDMYSWLNEGVALVKNKLNLSNAEYTASAETTLTITSGTSEYTLPTDFADLIQITDGTTSKQPIRWISIRDAMTYTGDETRYYIRGKKIGIVPTPSTDTTYPYRYRSKGTVVDSMEDTIDLPDNGFYILKDWMMWRAYLKFQNPNAATFYQSFTDGLNAMIVSSIKRDANLDTWGHTPESME